ncbi:helix-turn-helix domain-containing protein [Leucobacter massiliensis]|nr:helix-turn-helix transcriptional regulator [Leucobacter massiliensis]
MKNATIQKRPRQRLSGIDPRRKRVADEVRACIARSGNSRAAVEDAIGISQSALSRKLRAESAFTVDELLGLAAFLDVEASEFFPKERAR